MKHTKLFLAVLGAIAMANCSTIVTASKVPIESSSNLEFARDEIVAKKSGGRSGGGSFKRKPSRSKSSSPSRSSTKSKSKSYSSPSRSYERTNSTWRNDRDRQDRRRNSSSGSSYRSHRSNRSSSGFGNFVFFLFCLLFLGGLIFVAFYVLKQMANSDRKAEGKIATERDNDRVTVSVLQVVLSADAENLQQDLSSLATNADTDSVEGVVELMKESALLLMRNESYWTHVSSNSQSIDINNAESEFAKISFAQRSKFSSESLSNVDGEITTRESRFSNEDGFPAYLVVTLIIGSADDRPLFEKINSIEELQQALQTLSGMRDDYLMKFELLWTPQTANEYLTDEELLMEYTDVIPL